MSFITDEELKVALRDLLSELDVTELPQSAASIAARANVSAYGDIIRALVGRGFTKAQADTWIDGPTFQRDIGLYWCVLHLNGLDAIPAGSAATWGFLDRRVELETVLILDSNYEEIEYDTSAASIGYGTLNTDGDLNVADPNDPRRGEITRW